VALIRDACHGRAELVIERLPTPWAEEGLGSGWPPLPPPPPSSSESGDASHALGVCRRLCTTGHDASARKSFRDALIRYMSPFVFSGQAITRGKGCEDGGR